MDYLYYILDVLYHHRLFTVLLVLLVVGVALRSELIYIFILVHANNVRVRAIFNR